VSELTRDFDAEEFGRLVAERDAALAREAEWRGHAEKLAEALDGLLAPDELPARDRKRALREYRESGDAEAAEIMQAFTDRVRERTDKAKDALRAFDSFRGEQE